MKYCPKCKTEYEDWVKFCADCQDKLTNQLPKENTSDSQEQRGKTFVTVYKNIVLPPVEMVKSALENEDILCNMKGYDETRPGLSFGVGIELQVPEKDRAKAEKIIKELNVK